MRPLSLRTGNRAANDPKSSTNVARGEGRGLEPRVRRREAVSLDSSEVANLLREFGLRTALRGGNPFRAKAYARAADSLLSLTIPLDRIVAENRLREIPGVGAAIADIIARLHRTGSHPALEAMRKEIPAGVLEMLSIPGLRPDKVLKLHKELGVATIADLGEAARAGRLKGIKGLGPALERKILQGIEIKNQSAGRRHLHRAAELLRSAEQELRNAYSDVGRIVPAGEFRRGCELVGALSLVAEIPLLEAPQTIKATNQLTLYFADTSRFGATLLAATGAEAHLEGLRRLAAGKGLVLDAQGLRHGAKIVAGAREDDIYAALELPFIPPELREGGDEIARAREGRLPILVEDNDICGILHAHTDLSDGGNTLEDMAEAVRTRGYRYFSVADHSKSAHYAGGLSIDTIFRQHAAIDRLNAGYGRDFRILKGIESDILADGSLDYPLEVLARFDFVIASIHSHFRRDPAVQTERLLRAVANPFTTILGHMTGRQLLRRAGYDIDIEKVLAACAEHGVAVEINANPWRLDLDWRWHRKALELGCLMSINPDAHSIREIDLTHWGVEMARKGGVSKDKVLNCLSLKDLAAHLRNRRRRFCRQRLISRNRTNSTGVGLGVTECQKGVPMEREHIKGAADKAKGTVKDAAGKMTGDKKMQTEGKLDKAKGAAHEAAGDVKDAFRKATE
jgi:DNA polymerase (family 10)